MRLTEQSSNLKYRKSLAEGDSCRIRQMKEAELLTSSLHFALIST